MTSEDFSLLTVDEQEAFINGGGTIVSTISPMAAPSPTGFHSPVEEVKDAVLSPASDALEGRSEVQGVNGNLPEPSLSSKDTEYQNGFDIKDPVELLFLLDENIKEGRVILHPWQVTFMLDFAAGGISDQTPFQSVVRACNGSGKDKYIIAPCVVWLCMKFKKAIGVVTSSSGAQLDNQTCRYIKQLCEGVNSKMGHEIWQTKYRQYNCDFGTGLGDISQIFCYATDEAGKAEGYHPTDFNCKMGIFVSEDKTVGDDINVALNKCTGYTHRVHVSTPGLPMGHFFDYCSTAIMRKEIASVYDVKPIDWIQYVVTAYDCSHISKAYIEQMRRDLPGHENGAAFKSQVLAEFGTTDEMVVIPYTYIWNTIKHPAIHIPEEFNKAGLDLSDGGDETVLTIRNGNKHLLTIPFRFDNTEDTIEFLNEKFKEHKLTSEHAYIFADMGGLGKPMLDRMKRQGWSNIRYIDNRTASSRPKTYKNRGAELYFNVRLLFERNELNMIDDPILIRQLSTRYYKLVEGSVHQLLSKVESRSKGYPSPDRADSFTLAFWDYKSTYTENILTTKPFTIDESKTTDKIVPDFDIKQWAKGNAKGFTVNQHVNNLESLQEELQDYNRRLANK